AVHVGHNCLPEAISLAAHARQTGAAAVAVMSPSYFKPATIQDLIDFCAPIAAEAEPLPFYFYDIPGMTGVRLKMSEFLYQARFQIPTLRGLKYSNDDLLELQECVRLDHGAFDVLFGLDECLLAGLFLGIRGAVGNTFNFAAPVYQRLMQAFGKRDLDIARAEQGKSIDLIKTLGEFGFLAASKNVMAMLGVDCGPVRPPLRNLTIDQRLALWQRLTELEGRFRDACFCCARWNDVASERSVFPPCGSDFSGVINLTSLRAVPLKQARCTNASSNQIWRAVFQAFSACASSLRKSLGFLVITIY